MSAPAPAAFSTTRTHIAGVPVAELARQFGTPTFVYDAAMILRRLADLAAFDARPLCPKGLLEPGHARPGPPPRRAGRCGQRGRNPPRPGRRLRGRRRRRRRSSTRPTSSTPRRSTCASSANIHVNCGSPDMIDQLGRRAPGRQITLRINPGFGHGHSQKTNTGGKQAKHGIWHEQIGRVPGAGRPLSDSPSPACTCTSARAPTWSISRRSARRWSRRPRRSGPTVASISAGGGLPTVYRPERLLRRSGRLFRPLGRRAQAAGRALRPSPCGLEIEPGRYLVAESGYLVAEIRAVKRQGDNTVLPAGRRLQQSRPADPLRRLSSDVDRARPTAIAAARAGGDRRRAAVRVGRHLHAGGRRLRLPPAACPRPRWASCW